MASYRIQINTGAKGEALEHAQYIQREGRFTPEKYGAVAARGMANFPEWAREDPSAFWKASDQYERANGNTYREFELTLPRELSRAEQIALVERFAEQELGSSRPYQWALHTPLASDGKEQPHAHLMFSDRQLDGIERGPEQFFKRYNAKHPEKGGCRKATYGANQAEAALAYEGIRARRASAENQALAQAGAEARVDHRSLADQGIRDREPGRHRGPAVSGIEARGEVSEVGQRQREQRQVRSQARQRVVAEVRAVTRQEVAAERVAVRERRELAAEATGTERAVVLKHVEVDRSEQLKRAGAMAERRVERRAGLSVGSQLKEKLLTQARALRERIGRELKRVREWVRERFPEPLRQMKERSRELFEAAVGKGRRSGREAERSAQAPDGTQRERFERLNTAEIRALIAQIKPPSIDQLVERDPTVSRVRQEVERHQGTAHQALQTETQAAQESHTWRQAHGLQAKLHDRGVMKAEYLAVREALRLEAQRTRAESLKASGQALAQLAHARGEAAARITQEAAPARAQVAELRHLMTAAYEREQLVEQFKELAQGRAAGQASYQDNGPAWQATPPKLRQAIDAYNREPRQVQEEILERFARTSVLVNTLGEDLQRRREQVRAQQRDHGSELER